jgi:hypothetical protein
MKKMLKTAKYSLFLAIALISVVSISPNKALAGGFGDWTTGSLSGGDYYDYTPVSTYGGGSSDYYDYTPISTYGGGSSDYYDYTPVSTYSSYSAPSYRSSGGGYSYTPSRSYTYVPSPSYSYTPSRGSSYVPSSSAPSYQYVYSSNTNTNTNTNTATANNTNTITNNPVNVFNPTNNNDARINLVVLGGGTSGNNQPTQQSLDGSCSISPSTVNVNQDVSFFASATGGNGSYTYSWTGDNGINATGQSFTGRFSYPGNKTATVTIYSNGQSITRTCNVNVQGGSYYGGSLSAYCSANTQNVAVGQPVTWTVTPTGGTGSYSYTWSGESIYGTNGQTVSATYNTPGYKTASVNVYSNGQSITATCSTNIGQYGTPISGVYTNPSNVTVIRQPSASQPVSGVYLNQVPETGISFGLKMTLFSVGILMWSLFAAYIINAKRSKTLALANNTDVASRIEAFKQRNLAKKI